MMQLPTEIPARVGRAPGDWQIPAVIHQTFRSTEVTAAMHRAVMSWVDTNPEYTHRFYDDAVVEHFIETRFDAETLRAYRKIEAGAFKADFWRVCMLYAEGGVYADIDTVCVEPLSSLLTPGDRFVSAAAGPPRDFAIYNCFICAAPGHPFLEAALARSTDLLLNGGKRYDGYDATGPGNLGRAANRVLKRPEQSAHDHGSHQAEFGTYRLLEKRTATESMSRHLAWEGKPILFTEYETYKEDLAELGVRYWRDMPVYNDAIARSRRTLRMFLSVFHR